MTSQTEFVEDVLADVRAQSAGKTFYWPGQSNDVLDPLLARLADAPPEAVVEFAIASLRIIHKEETWLAYVLKQAVGQVLRRKLTFTEDQVIEMIHLVSVPHKEFPFKGVLKAAESRMMTPRLADALRLLRPSITEFLGGGQARDLHARIDNILHGPAPETSLQVQGAWSQIVFAEIAQSEHKEAWERIFFHTVELRSSDAPKRWRTAAQQLVQQLGREVFLEAARRWLALGPSPDRPGVQVSSGEADFQKGFLWFLADLHDDCLPSLLAGFAERALKKIPMLGAVSQKVGNASVNVLAELPGLDPVSHLSALARRIKYDTAQRLIEAALTRAAEKAGVSRDQLEEMSVPDFTLTHHFGDYLLTLSIEDTISVALCWRDPQGKELKGAPAYVKEHHAEEWKDLQRTIKDTEKLLSAHRLRIERLLLTQRPIPIETLRSAYLDHPLLSDMSRRLVWQFESGLGVWHNGRMVDDAEREIDLGAQKTARLWHPASSDVPVIFHWRCWLEDHHIRQPFKQAHREVYLITAAEHETATYSNRFAAHILRQHQFAALCEQLGWSFRLMGQWDSHNTPTLDLPPFGLRVQYDVDFPQDENGVSGHAIYLLIRTGALRFLDGTHIARPLDSIPPIVFSEVMRDVDLFTGVASIGSDPAWGQQRFIPFERYWTAMSFGELNEMARGRRGVLERLIPRLTIKDRCTLDDRHLVVRGDRATYRIHLGSGNILMEPGSRYLCIVEAAATKGTPRSVSLPFEGDQKLSLILSKAFLLAEDGKIKDQSILRQLPPG